uniref:Uncharacterized protein n=1 Tax=Nicotiana tabacum TaxID=4097 RepID=A0A1S4CWQ8_TOBAC|nr:PREDICTED: uncharacterized protein LOC107823463 [Nicotiana tabacum]
MSGWNDLSQLPPVTSSRPRHLPSRNCETALTGISGPISGASASSRSPPAREQAPKKKAFLRDRGNASPKSSSEVMVTSLLPGAATDTLMIDDDGEASEEEASLHRRRRPSSTQQTSQYVELITPTEDDVSALWGDTAFVATASHLSPPSSLSSYSPTPAIAPSSPPSLTLPPATTTSYPLVASALEEGVLLPQSPQREQEVVTLSQDIGPLRVKFNEAKAKWVEVHSVVLAATNREAASTERLTNLEAALNSKTEELAATGVKHAQLEEKYKKTIEHNRLFSSTVHELNVSLKSIRSAQENLSAEVTQLKQELKRREVFLVVEKNYVMYITRRKPLKEAKASIIDFDVEIAKARELKSATKMGLPPGPDASGSSGSGSEILGIVEKMEGEDVKGQTD